MDTTSADEVRALVEKFWDYFVRKSKSEFDKMYSPAATVFAADARRGEPARLMLVRRARELFGPASAVGAKLDAIDVQILRDDLAVASYAFHFNVTRSLPNGKRVSVDVPFGRATQVFQRDTNGNLRIIHEHMSSAAPVSPKELPATAKE
ncbi:MAG TPA: nuclear transport factor 2 family protein [Candidatus Sulfotelmatobacter sp.]|nr:nuclear transport factor 2 family protein [Candidatus Sulfotelmatobacter sp.]